jgi:hypothetical protein
MSRAHDATAHRLHEAFGKIGAIVGIAQVAGDVREPPAYRSG